MKSVDFLFMMLMWLIARKTPYSRVADVIVFVVLVLHSIKLCMMYIPKQISFYRDEYIRPGNIVSSFLFMAYQPSYIITRQIVSMITGYPYYHTALAVEYKGGIYMLHVRSPDADTDELIDRNGYRNEIEVIYQHGTFSFMLEPLRCFLDVEKRFGSCLRIMDTGRYLSFEKEIAEIKPDTSMVHCGYFIGKYLERLGMCSNKTMLADSLYYTPRFFYETFQHIRDVKL